MSTPYSNFRSHPFGAGLVTPPGALVKDIDTKQGIVRGYFAAFGNVDSYGDVIVKGAFAKTIQEWGPGGKKRIAHLMDHNPTHRVGVIQELEEDAHGLLFTSKMLGQDHSKGRDALIEYEEGAITEHSIGFSILKWERNDDDSDSPFYLTELKLYEGSGVTWGANMETPVVDVKALIADPSMLDNVIDNITRIKRISQREITDERAQELEAMLQSASGALKALESALREEVVPSEDTRHAQPPSEAELMLDIVKGLQTQV